MRSFVVLDNWQNGAFHLRKEFDIAQTINDGQDNYPPGSNSSDYYVYVSDGQAASDPATWTMVAQDRFTDNALGWTLGESDDEWTKSSTSISQGALSVSLTQAKQDFISWDGPDLLVSTDFEDFVNVRMESSTSKTSDCYGLFFGGDGSQSSRYVFAVCDNQEFDLLSLKDGQWTTLINWANSTAIVPGQTNILTVIVQGQTIQCQINGSQVGQVSGQDISGGVIGISYQAAKGDAAEYDYSNFILRVPLPAGMPLIPTATK